MTTIPDRIRSNVIGHSVDVLRYEAGLRAKIDAMVRDLGDALNRALLGSGLDAPRTDWQQARLRALIKEVSAMVQRGYAGIGSEAAKELQGLVRVTSAGVTTAINDAIGARLLVPPKWPIEQLRALVDGSLIQGAPSQLWWERQGQDLTRAFSDQMRQGVMHGENITQLRDRIMGQPLPGIRKGPGRAGFGKVDLSTVQPRLRAPIWTARRNAEALVRTSVITMANAAHHAAYMANSDILGGETWCSTLDTRTCLAGDTQIQTPSGAVPIKDIHVGDMVIGGSGLPRKVLGTSSKRVKRTMFVTLSNGERVRCTEDHLWLDADGNWIEAGALIPGVSLASELK